MKLSDTENKRDSRLSLASLAVILGEDSGEVGGVDCGEEEGEDAADEGRGEEGGDGQGLLSSCSNSSLIDISCNAWEYGNSENCCK
jgi:hypothetical protein